MAVLIYDSKGQPYAKGYYEVFKTEPYASGASLTVTKMYPLAAWHLPGLLSAIEKHCVSEKELLIVGHGTTHGLSIPLAVRKKKTAAQYRQLLSLMGNKTDKEKAVRCTISEAEVKQILTLRAKVLKLKLQRVEFRACEMGQSTLALSALKNFLGAGIVGAPDMLDFFGTLDFGTPNKDVQQWQEWQKAHPNPRIFSMPGGKVAVQRLLQFNCRTETTQAVREWAKKFLPAPTKPVGTQKLPVHAFVGRTFLFPNEAAYVKHIKHYSKGNPLLQGDIFGGTGALEIPEIASEQRMLARTGRRVPGPVDREIPAAVQTWTRRGPTGIA